MSIDFDEQKNRLLKNRHFRKFTIIFVDSRCVKWKWNAIIVFKKRIFVSWKFVLLFHSRKFVLLFRDSFRENFRFVDLKMFYVNFIQFTKIRFVVSWFLFKKTFWRFYLIIRVFRRTIFAKFDRMSINLAKFKTKNLVVLKTWKWSRHRHCNW